MQTYREILKNKFNEEYNKLNAEQQKAVDTIEGPVMVIAGPGTVKRKFSLPVSGRFYWKQMCRHEIFYASLIQMQAHLP